jgi:hypothetical protein
MGTEMRKYNDAPDEFDRRQLQTMQAALDGEDRSQESLGELASRLLALRDLFHWHDPEWDYSFTDNVATLDSCSLASPEQIRIMGERYEQVVQAAVESLRKLVENALSR